MPCDVFYSNERAPQLSYVETFYFLQYDLSYKLDDGFIPMKQSRHIIS